MIKCKKEDGIKLTDHNLSGIIQKLVEGGYEIDCDRTNDRIELRVYRVSRRHGRGKLFMTDQFIRITDDNVEWGDESRGYKAYYLYNEFSDDWLPKLYDAKNLRAFNIMNYDSAELEIIDTKKKFHRGLVEDTILVFDEDNNFVELLKCEVNPRIVLEDNGYEVVS